jgi:hypothetical protein
MDNFYILRGKRAAAIRTAMSQRIRKSIYYRFVWLPILQQDASETTH